MLDGFAHQLNGIDGVKDLQGRVEFIKKCVGNSPRIIAAVLASRRGVPDDFAQLGATRLLAGIVVPDTPIVTRAVEYAREHCEPYLFNHVMRSWLFSAAIAQLKHSPHDAEVLAVATLLHDLGLAKAFSGPLRFEVEGANAARAFARAEGMMENRAQLIWDGVVLNSTPSIGLYKENEVALCTMSIGLDWGGWLGLRDVDRKSGGDDRGSIS